jgi:hypothetical protein
VNDELQYTFEVSDIEVKPSGKLLKVAVQVNIKGRDKPAMIGTFLTLLLGA